MKSKILLNISNSSCQLNTINQKFYSEFSQHKTIFKTYKNKICSITFTDVDEYLIKYE